MMDLKKVSLLAASLIGLAGLGLPTAASGDVQELLKLTRVAEQIAFDIEENRRLMQLKCAASERCNVYQKELVSSLESAEKNLSLGPVVVPLIAEMFQHMEPGEPEALLAFYRSDVGRKVVQLEAAGRGAELLEKVKQEGAAIYGRQTDERFALLEGIDSQADFSPARRMLDRLADRVVDWLEKTAEENELQGAPTDVQVPDRSRHAYHQWLAAVFESMSDEDLAVYVEFLESGPGEQWMATHRDLRRRSVETAIAPVLDRLAGRLGD